MTIGERIRNRRLELNMTQDELAKKAGYKSRSSINKIELSRDLPLRKISKVAAALDITPTELCGWEEADSETPVETTDNIKMEYKLQNDIVVEIEKLNLKEEQLKRLMRFLVLYSQLPPDKQKAIESLLE